MTAEERFLESRAHWPAMAGWGARLSNRSLVVHSNDPSLSASNIEQAVARLALAAESLAYHDLSPVRLCWSFEKLCIHIGWRPDGVCLAVFMPKGQGANQDLNALLDEFAALRIG